MQLHISNRTARVLALVTMVLVPIIASVDTARAHPPPFYWMSDLSADSRVGVDTAVGASEFAVNALPVVALSLFVEMAVFGNFSIVGRLPLAYVSYEPPDDPSAEESEFVLGNAGLGVKLATSSQRRSGARTRYGLDGYVHLPTASDSAEKALAVAAAGSLAVPDSGRYLIDTTTLRLRGSGRYESASLFLQGELGLDHHLRSSAEDTTDLLVALGAGVAISPYYALLSELSLVIGPLDDRELLPVLDVGVRYHNPGTMAGLRLHLPLAKQYREADVIAVAVDLGLRF